MCIDAGLDRSSSLPALCTSLSVQLVSQLSMKRNFFFSVTCLIFAMLFIDGGEMGKGGRKRHVECCFLTFRQEKLHWNMEILGDFFRGYFGVGGTCLACLTGHSREERKWREHVTQGFSFPHDCCTTQKPNTINFLALPSFSLNPKQNLNPEFAQI